MVRVPVREAQGFDGREPDAEPTRVLQPDLGGGSDVEEDRALFGAAPPRDQRREAVAGEAHVYPRWIACRSRCPRRRPGPARRAPRSPQDSIALSCRLVLLLLQLRNPPSTTG